MTKLPEDFVHQMKVLLSEEYPAFESGLSRPPVTSIRCNPHRTSALASLDLDGPVPWCPQAYFLKSRPKFNQEPDFYTGSYYVQEASSMFLSHILSQIELPHDAVALDACAAPGGKTVILHDRIGPRGTLIANEVIRSRAKVLHENLSKWGGCNHIVTNSDLSRFEALSGELDLIVVDAPCSGEGLFRKDAQASSHWSEDHVKHCALRQKRILADAVPLLREGAYLIYSTCTYNRQENEDQVAWLCQEYGMKVIDIPIPESWNIYRSEGAYRFFPHRVRGEGLFMAVLQAGGTKAASKAEHKRKYKKQSDVSKHDLQELREYIQIDQKEDITTYQEEFVHYTGRINIDQLSSIRIYSFGRPIGQIMKKGFRPAAQLAQSIHLSNQIERIELSAEEVLKVMNHQDIPSDNGQKAWYLLTYSQNSVHFAKTHRQRHKIQYPKF